FIVDALARDLDELAPDFQGNLSGPTASWAVIECGEHATRREAVAPLARHVIRDSQPPRDLLVADASRGEQQDPSSDDCTMGRGRAPRSPLQLGTLLAGQDHSRGGTAGGHARSDPDTPVPVACVAPTNFRRRVLG